MKRPWEGTGRLHRIESPTANERGSTPAHTSQVEISGLRRLAEALNASFDASSLVLALANEATCLLGFERVSLAIKTADPFMVRLWRADRRLETLEAPERSLNIRHGAIGSVVRSGNAVCNQDLGLLEIDGARSRRGSMALPLYSGDDVFGVLCFEAVEGRSMPESALPVAELIAMQASATARNIQLAGELGIADDMIFTLAMAIEAKDPYTQGHCDRVARYAVAIGERFDLSSREIRLLYKGAFLHDIGKIGIRDAVLLKEGPLSALEYEHIKEHPTIGARILGNLASSSIIVPMVLYHHERWDGAGYPDRLVGDQTPLMARIVSVADAFDAMTTTRCYRPALSCERALAILSDHAGTQWDPTVVREFLSVIRVQVEATGSFEIA